MTWKTGFRNISMLVLFVFVTACSAPTAVATTEPTATQAPIDTATPAFTETPSITESPVVTEPPVSAGVAGNELCANAYYPVREGATWTYSSSGGPAGPFDFTDTISAVREDGFTLTSSYWDLAQTQEWGCKEEGLVALQLGRTALATLNNNKVKVTLDVEHVSGVTFPSEIQPGDTWEHTLEFTGKITVAGQEIEATGDAKSSFQAIGNESVTVRAGTFDALKIHTETAFNFNGDVGGVAFPVTVSSPYDYWFVQGVGWVKAVGTSTIANQTFSETIELQSYSIP